MKNNNYTNITFSTRAHELLLEGHTLSSCFNYRAALFCFRSLLDIRCFHIYTEPRLSILDIDTEHIYIAMTLGDINRQEGTDNSRDVATTRAEMSNHYLKSAVIHRDALGATNEVTQQIWELYDTV